LAALVAGPTVRQMAAAIRELRAGPAAPPAPVVPLQTHGTLPPLFCVHPAGRGVNNYVHLVRHLGSDQPVFGVVDLGDDLARPIPRIAAEHLQAIRALQAEGPYYLLGWSFGAIIVYEMALQLEREHQQVAFLGLMDGVEPELWRGLPEPDGALRVATLATEVAERMSRPFSLRREDLQGLSLDEQCLRAAEALHAQVGAPVDLSAAHLRESCHVVQARDETKRRYTAGEIQGRMTLFLPHEAPIERQRYFAAFDESERGTLGWHRLVRGGIEIHQIPGTHMAMGCEPHVRVLAERVRESLAAARNRVGGQDA
jgi:thioesterase domain-containing protein